jgi:hypothetical protein
MKKLAFVALALVVISGLMALPVLAARPDSGASTCTTIQDGTLTYSDGHYLAGEPLETGYDPYGYNYQGHMFKGSYFNAYSGGAGFAPYEGDDDAYLEEYPGAETHWAWPYREVNLVMKWNDAWLSNKDCDSDGKLDRHYGFPSYKGSGAWETNHMWGEDLDEDGNPYKWNYFCKIVAVPADALLDEGIWYTPDGIVIGPVIWGEFATIQEVSNDPGLNEHGCIYKSPASAGFGFYAP